MNETQRNIQAYKAALPGLKERVLAVALLLVMSAVMMTSATFAWITLSRAPEVSNATTTMAANGNLEIALVNPEGSQPAESAVGDSSAAEGQSVVKANLTWGNLVNLSDDSYGLGAIVMRPALLGNINDLLSQPLKGVDYGEDGRLQQYYNEDYKFTNWTEQPGGGGYFEFSETPKYGVRAISTVEYTYVNNTYYQFNQLMNQATGIRQTVENKYTAITENKTYIDALAAMIGTHMTDNLNDSNTDVSAHIKPLYKMMKEVYELLEGGSEDDVYTFENAMAAMANAQVYMKYRDQYLPYSYTGESLMQATNADLQANGVNFACLARYKTMKENFRKVVYGTDPTKDDCIYDFFVKAYHYTNDQGQPDEDRRDTSVKIYMEDLIPYVNAMVKIDTCELVLANGTSYKINQIGKSVAASLLMGGDLKDCNARITEGHLVEFERITGCNMNAKNVTVTAKYIISVDITAKTIKTAAPAVSLYEEDVENIRTVAGQDKGDYTAVAQDTYGMALDFWVRTNAPSSYLILEGNVLTETEMVRETGLDSKGNTVELYTATITNKVTNEGQEETMSEEVAVYQAEDEEGNLTWYRAKGHGLLYIYDENGNLPEGQTISTPIERWKEESKVIGYEGENRIWDDKALLDTDSTTQGNGSCYVFYADDPTQQSNSLRLLSNLRVAFIDSDPDSINCGKMIAVGKLDTENRYEESGKVTIPLVLFNDGSNNLTQYEEGLAIMPLERSKAHRLTAVIYLDGRDISNADVLAANEIHGQLNIQFGSTENMKPIDNEELELATRSVSAVIKKPSDSSYPANNNGPKYDPETGELTSAPDVQFAFDQATETNPMTVSVKVKIDGDRASKVETFFMRKVSSAQGSRETVFRLTESTTEPGVYEGTYTFDAPGEYVLRTVQLDGVDYSLPADNHPRVFIEGFGITGVTLSRDGQEITEQLTTIMTDKRNLSADLSVKFASSVKMPSDVKLQFVRDEDNMQVMVNMIAGTNGWTGTANFTSSGLYTLKYVILDGEYTELEQRHQKQLDLSMGLSVKIIDEGDYRNFTFDGKSVTVPMQVEIYDDNDQEIKYLSGVKLYYSNSGSPISGSNPDVTWNAAKDCYVGHLLIPGAGVYTFSNVFVEGTPLTSTVNVPPTFICASPNPPAYVDNEPMEEMDYLLSTGSNTHSVGVRLSDAQGATVYAQIRNDDLLTDKTKEVLGVRSIDEQTGITTFHFELPKEIGTNYQSGDWTITGLKLYNVYDGDGNFYSQGATPETDNPMRMDLAQTGDDLHVKIVNVVADLVDKDKDETLDGGVFMGTATAKNAIKVKITDQNGEALDPDYVSVANLKIRYIYKNGTSSTHGHYTSQQTPADVEITSASSDGTTYTMNIPTFGYAGEYEAYSLTFDVSNKDTGEMLRSFNYTSEELKGANTNNTGILRLPVYTLKTAAPTVKVTGTTTGTINVHTGTRAADGSVAYDQTISGDFNKRTDYTATVFLAASNRNVNIPEVRLTLSGMPSSGFTASMAFPNASDSSYDKTYQFTANNQEKSQTIGGRENGSGGILGFGASDPKIFPAGKQTVDKITVVYNGATYTVDLSNAITINQPQVPLYADFTINSSYTGTVPGRVYSTDGETIKITLPTANDVTTTWNEAKTDTSITAFTPKTTTNTDYYETWSDGCDGDMYQKYTKTVTVAEADETITTYTRKWTITGWKIGNTTYGFGETVTVTSSQTITAVLTSADSGHSTTKNLVTRTTKYFTVGSDTQGTPPSGYQNVTSDPDNSNKDRWTSSSPNVTDVRTPKN